MKIIDSIAERLGYIPKSNGKRPRAGARLFDAAIIDRTAYSWGTSGASLDGMIYQALTMLRRRSRNLCYNNEYGRQFIRLAKLNIAGPEGFIFQSKARRQDGQLDKADNDRIERAWARQSSKVNFCADGRTTRQLAEQICVEHLIRDGEVLVQKIPNYGKNDTGYAIKFIDPDRLDIQKNTARDPRTGLRTIMGVTLDDDGRPVEYHLLSQHPEGAYLQTDVNYSQQHVVIPAENIIHMFLPMGGEQHRGVPWFHASILSLKDLGGYREAAVIAARVGAAKMGFITSPEGDAYGAQGEDSEGNTVMTAEPGVFEQLPTGTDVTSWDPQYPHEQFEAFNKEMLRGIAASLGCAYHNLTGNLEGVNFSSSRMGEFKEREVWTALQNFVSTYFDQDIYEDWLKYSLFYGRLEGIPPTRFDKFAAPKWQGRRWAAIQPVEQANADAMQYGLRTKSISQIIREQAQDPDEVWNEIAEDNRRLRELGIEPTLINALTPESESNEAAP